ncbi:hypothetical protein CWE08_04475 [Aliidiomarina iranensis]|uniref:Uncharacterized protein n=1 Tax=Aliidiomarina iranensis TaxID=1434071 RepID=A0A432W0C3_9GAMM|nr:DsrE family protein [Aliidiomarina iranensis]RUO22438.1 hypothetical protein CWE08_04475 [Aliidiomarina iranensis]
MNQDSHVILMQASPDDHTAGIAALAKAQDIVRRGQTLKQVFFYGPAVIYGSRFLQFPSGYSNLQEQWRELAQTHDFALVVCATVGGQYGLEALPPPDGNLAADFSAGGLAEFIATLAESSHLSQFQGSF